MNPNLTHLSRISARLALAGMLLMQVVQSIQAQEVRITKFTRDYEGVGGYILILDNAITNAGPESFLYRTNISVDWSLSDAGHRMTKTYWDYFGGVGQQLWPQGSWETLNYVRDEWPALPDLGINYVYYGPNRLYSDGARTNTSPVDNRGTGEFRYASYTNDTSTSETFVFSDENGNAITNTVINTNRVAETTKWEAEVMAESVIGSSNSYLHAVYFKPTDLNGMPVPFGNIKFGTNTLKEDWMVCVELTENEWTDITPEFDNAVNCADGAPAVGEVKVRPVLNTSGNFAAGNNLANTLGNYFKDENGNPRPVQLGGPLAIFDPTTQQFEKVGYVIEITAKIPDIKDIPLNECTFLQTAWGMMVWSFDMTVVERQMDGIQTMDQILHSSSETRLQGHST